MSLVLQTPKHVVTLATSAVIVNPRITVYTGKKSDDAMADKVSHNEGASERVMTVSHDLFVHDLDLRALLNHRQTFYNFLNRETYDWAGPLRLLEAAKIPEFMQAYETKIRDVFYQLRDKFLLTYDDKVSAALFIRGTLGKREDYPPADWLKDRFTISLQLMEVPQGDFRVNGVAQALLDDCRVNFQQQAEDYIHNLAKEQLGKLIDVMKSIAHCCELEQKVNADGSVQIKKRRLYDSTVEKAIAYCDEFKRFNIAEDPELEVTRAALAQVLDGINVAALRDSETMRADVKSSLDSILSKF